MKKAVKAIGLASVTLALVASSAQPASADNAWSVYHWARLANPFAIQVVDSLTDDWDARLASVNSDWNVSSKMDNIIVPGDEGNQARRKCNGISGKIRVCNQSYGFNGWIGLATIGLTTGSHIFYGTTKLNESYFGLSSFNTEEARRHVACQEIGHDFGLDHQHAGDIGGGVTCMNDIDGINDPAYVSPNAHDYDQLDTIYAHTDSFSSIASSLGTSLIFADDGSSVVSVTWA